MPRLAPALPDVAAILELERSSPADGVVRVLNRWVVRQQLPSFLREHLGSGELGWLDCAEWRADDFVCRWIIKPSIKGEVVSCDGETRFEPAMGGRGTRVTFSGRLSIAPGLLSGVAAGIERPLMGFVETIATTMIPGNFRQVVEAASRTTASKAH